MKENNIELYNYDLPEELIAQSPLEKRDESKLLVLNKFNGNIKHKQFKDIISFLHKGDILVLNNTKVIPARIFGYKTDTNAKIEILLLKEFEDKKNTWECLVKHQKRLKEGTVIKFSDELSGECIKILDDGITHIKMIYNGVFLEIIERIGIMPLPPYIHEKLNEQDRYQTVYAKNLGSAAAPTAGLHFTKDLLKEIEEKGIKICYVTLNVGLGTFRPVSETDITKHHMHSELYKIDEETANTLNKAKKEGTRIIAVGTTSLRTLESNISKYGEFKATEEETDIFIYPPYKIKSIDALITNFHLPKSTLVMLVSAFSTREIILNAYNEAIKNNYRFFSFGDAMFLTNDIDSED